jgi:hypothetical protein
MFQTLSATVGDGYVHELPSGVYVWTCVRKLDMHAGAPIHIPLADVCEVNLSNYIFYGILGTHMVSHLQKDEYS